MPGNRDAVLVWGAVQDQLITVVEGRAAALGQMIIRSRPVGINHQAIHQAMGLYQVADRRGCFEKVLRLSREFITEANEH